MNLRELLFSVLAVFLVVPIIVLAQTLPASPDGGLVPCGDVGEPACQTCHVVDLVENVSAWLVAVLSVLVIIAFTLAGYRIVTATGNQTVIVQSRRFVTNVIIGFVLVLGAWILISMLLRALLIDGDAALGPWRALECVEQPGNSRLSQQYLQGEPLAGSELLTTTRCGSVDQCAALAEQCNNRPGGSANITGSPGSLQVDCEFTSTDLASQPPDLSAGGACDADLVARYFPEQVGNAQCVIRGESTCGAELVSGTDVMNADNRAFSFGPMQINLTVHTLEGCGPGGTTLRCLDAFAGNSYNARVINESLYQQCARAAQTTECHFQNARRIYDDALRRHGNGWQPWTAAGSGGCRLHNFY